ncbi:NAD(+) synthase [Mycoplasma phocoeninasale]|uniref:NAD(+) synthase n=1 Tax=Mycoplasma phocoeninasale TaxID=2726117 RepID=UPI0019687E35|nr:NAD(+) synthase [Mycoplasma phocoeninasale]MBN0970816.1 NAD(+) synthase [Mycoplasma phocoeninasale]
MKAINNFNNPELTKKETKIYQSYINKLKNWLIQKNSLAKTNGISLGISGGIDSAVLATVAKLSFPNNANFYYFKTKEDKYTEKHINLLEKTLQQTIKIIDLTSHFNDLKNTLEIQTQTSLANLKSRLYMTSIYALSQDKNTLVLGTDNFDEYYLGYFTKYGDGGCDLLPFANIKKSDVYALAKILNIPSEIINKKPSANLLENQDDESELGFSYEEFELWKRDKNLVSKEISNRIQDLYKKTAHKRSLPPKGPKLKG